MTTKRLVLDLIAFSIVIAFLLFFIPFALNATDSILNVLGVSVIAGLVIGIIANIHRKFTQTNEEDNEE